MKLALIKDGEIDNIIVADENYIPPDGMTVMALEDAIAQNIPRKQSKQIVIEPPPVTISRAQFGEMMIRRGIKQQVETVLNAIPDEVERSIMLEWYEYTPTVRRNSPKVEAIRQILNISSEDADTWFQEALEYE